MGRRREPVEVVAAREVLRGRFVEQEAAVVRFFEAGARAAVLRSSLEEVEREQCRHAGALVELVGVSAAAQLTGWSRSRVVATQRAHRAQPG